MVTHHWNSKRFEQKPIRQPTYSFRNVPKCAKNLDGSSLQRIANRTEFQEATAEMVLLCREAARRNQSRIESKQAKKKSAKPLSLEYIADRLDVDDPIFGYIVRSEHRLQGFITVTTFTNWQKSFRWDSMHESAYSYDTDETTKKQKKGIRKYDKDGTLAEALQSTVRCGDIWNEGIVWPRIAEISLLGGLGCGKALVSLIIDELECSQPTANQNYDYVALQATDNSIPFYESLGFIRVGAVTEDDQYEKKLKKKRSRDTDSSDEMDTEDEITLGDESTDKKSIDDSTTDQDDSRGKPQRSEGSGSNEERTEIVSSALTSYTTKKDGETPKEIAGKLDVDVWDIVFLNHCIYPDFSPGSKLVKGTVLHVPCREKSQIQAISHAVRRLKTGSTEEPEAPLWFIAKENDTPRTIAKRFSLDWRDVIKANNDRLPDLVGGSRLRAGTRVKISHFHIPDEKHVPYCHWTFPDDTFDSCDPGYMMVRKLNRRPGETPQYLSSLAIPVSEFESSPLLLPAEPVSQKVEKKDPDKTNLDKKTKTKIRHPDEPKPPKKPPSPYMMFSKKHRGLLQREMKDKSSSDIKMALTIAWKELPENEKSLYYVASEKAKEEYMKEKEVYEVKLAKFKAANPEFYVRQEDENDLFCKVVKLKPEAMTDEIEYKYWFVLTYILDLKWCHLAPLKQVGTFGAENPGRPKWKLVDESLGKELDITSRLVIPIASRMMKQTDDADNEEWDILEAPSVTPILPPKKKKKASECGKKRQIKHIATTPVELKLSQSTNSKSPAIITAPVASNAPWQTPSLMPPWSTPNGAYSNAISSTPVPPHSGGAPGSYYTPECAVLPPLPYNYGHASSVPQHTGQYPPHMMPNTQPILWGSDPIYSGLGNPYLSSNGYRKRNGKKKKEKTTKNNKADSGNNAAPLHHQNGVVTSQHASQWGYPPKMQYTGGGCVEVQPILLNEHSSSGSDSTLTEPDSMMNSSASSKRHATTASSLNQSVPARKARKVNSSGSCRSVLQN